MKNNEDFMSSAEMVSMLEQLKHDIDDDIERRKLAYIGEDRKDYCDRESLDIANRAYVESIYKFIGKDGRQYGTITDLLTSDKLYEEYKNPKIMDNSDSIEFSKSSRLR